MQQRGRSNFPHRRGQRGLTLLELMIAMTISLIIVLAALAALLFAREGFTTVDTASQLRENTRFATELISRVTLQAGYQEWSEAGGSVQRNKDAGALGLTVSPDLQGFNNAMFDPTATPANNSRDSGCGSVTDTRCVNGSDVLVVRFQGMNDATGAADGSTIDCSGQPQGSVQAASGLAAGRATSVFYVDVAGSGEPALMCATVDAAGVWHTSPLVEGVESFQVLYGADGVTPGKDPKGLTLVPDSIVDQWLRADQLVVVGNAAGTNRNWQRIRAVRIGIAMRSTSAQSGAAPIDSKVYPFVDKTIPSTDDPGVELTVPKDRRVRQSFTFTIHLRNTLL